MRINRPSLYAAFGNKEQLLKKVLDQYMERPVAWFGKALAAPKARDVVEQIFLGTAGMAEDPRIPAGCLMVQGALACGSEFARKEVAARRAAVEVALRRRLQRAKREGDLPKNADPSWSGPLRDDGRARKGSPVSWRRQSQSTSSRRANRAACVAETLTRSSVAAKGESGLVTAGVKVED